ncbi:putative transcription factor [Forsythia ovata]|uniref:Transcription factor n=1 Tax=Forsythia ovata TaxID=205694 RepID=A0ABD1UA61_9LAMI
MDFTPTPPIQLKPSTSKLPIKRKTPDPTPPVNPNQFNANSPYGGGDPRSPPFKFHRIWTEPDEIRFLQGLLDCSSENLTFPRDLGIFYTRFSNTMSQPYTKSQLSEKLRRLRKKFRVISTRLSKGLDKSQLSPQDRGVGVGFGQVAAKVVMNVFNECLKEVKSGLIGHGGERANVGGESFEERWQQQRIAELDVLGHRLRLIDGKALPQERLCDLSVPRPMGGWGLNNILID